MCVDGVLGEYQHSFEFDQDDEFVILYGPNGVGKTKFLEIVNAISNLKVFALSKLPFSSATLTYSDGSVLTVQLLEGPGGEVDDQLSRGEVKFTLTVPGKKPEYWKYQDDSFAELVRRHTPYVQVSDEFWEDPEDGEVIRTSDLQERYLPSSRRILKEDATPPEIFQEFVARVPSFLIETQRLRSAESRMPRGSGPFGRMRRPNRTQSRINEQSTRIKELLNEAQTEHSRITQQKDRTFPSRVLEAARTSSDLDAQSIRERYADQNEFRSRLARVASVSLSEELALTEDHLEPWALALLDLYLDDTKAKLAPFEELLDKIELLEKIVNRRLLNKFLLVTDREGLTVQRSNNDQVIDLDSLSSGEQHEIILMIDLLINVPKGATVLIDEPEISLHVAWQLAFIPDVQEIAKMVGFKFVVATHSPQIINNAWDRAVRLGPQGAAFE